MVKIKNFIKNIRQPLLVTIVLLLICGLGFPLLLTGIAQIAFPDRANGSMIKINDKNVGSEFVGQEFTKPYFMKCRPSAVHYNTYTTDENGNKIFSDGSEFGGVASGSQNLAPSNPELAERVENSIEKFLQDNPDVKREDIPTDLLTASGSGLDPHISPASAKIQIPAIAKASGLSESVIEDIVKAHTKGKFLGVFGEETVNVLLVNIDIAEKMGLIK